MPQGKGLETVPPITRGWKDARRDGVQQEDKLRKDGQIPHQAKTSHMEGWMDMLSKVASMCVPQQNDTRRERGPCCA